MNEMYRAFGLNPTKFTYIPDYICQYPLFLEPQESYLSVEQNHEVVMVKSSASFSKLYSYFISCYLILSL